jgi:hypothetical protein
MSRSVLLLLALGSIGCSEYGMIPDGPVDLGTGPEDWSDPSTQPTGTPSDGPDDGEFIGRRPAGGDGDGPLSPEDPEAGGDVPAEDPEEDPGLDPDAGNGCTPGYWKQEQHVDSWTAPLTTETWFVDAFAVDAFPGLTLLDVLELGEGDLDSLGRHAVAALLNSLDVSVDYPLTDLEVVEEFTAAYDSGLYEATKSVFEVANEDHCPLN